MTYRIPQGEELLEPRDRPPYRILQGEELLEPRDRPHLLLAARRWTWVGCTCKPLGFTVGPYSDNDDSLTVRVVHDENCPTVGIPTEFSKAER